MIEKVKRNLWTRGYRVKDVSEFTDYDLLVEGKFRVFVISGDTELYNFALKTSVDFLALLKTDKTIKYSDFGKGDSNKIYNSPLDVFGRPRHDKIKVEKNKAKKK